MPKTSRESASETVEVEGYEGHMENLEGGYTVAFERYTADADYAPPGHTPVLYDGTEIVEFSPTEDLNRTMGVVVKNIEAGA